MIERPCHGIFVVDFLNTSEGSVGHIMYKVYILNRSSFMYCSVAAVFHGELCFMGSKTLGKVNHLVSWHGLGNVPLAVSLLSS